MGSHREIEDRAASWLARRDSGEWTASDEANLARWLESSTANRIAFLRLEAAWEQAARLKALGAGMPPRTTPPVGRWRRSPFFKWRAQIESTECVEPNPAAHKAREGFPWRFAAVAASLLMVAGLRRYFIYDRPANDRYSTPIGGLASVPLRDGSNITLNTRSELRVELTPDERRIELDKGEAYFVVAKDPGRPFVVHAGYTTVTAVGTQFSVRRDGIDVRVVVTEGTVTFEAERGGSSSPNVKGTESLAIDSTSRSGKAQIATLPAGTIARASGDDILVQDASLGRAEDLVTWRQGYLTFRETTLAEAVEEFNRYNAHRISIADPKVAAIRISGTFRPANYEAFIRLLRQGFSIHAERVDDTTVLVKD